MAKKTQVAGTPVNPEDFEDQPDFSGTPYEKSGKHDEIKPGGEYLIPRGNNLVPVNAKGERLDNPEDEPVEEEIPNGTTEV